MKTLMIIAHRLATIKNCDIVYMLDKGRFVDSGTYEELLRDNRQFQSMAKIVRSLAREDDKRTNQAINAGQSTPADCRASVVALCSREFVMEY